MIHPHPHIHLYAIGNALVDTEHHVSDEQLQALGIESPTAHREAETAKAHRG